MFVLGYCQRLSRMSKYHQVGGVIVFQPASLALVGFAQHSVQPLGAEVQNSIPNRIGVSV